MVRANKNYFVLETLGVKITVGIFHFNVKLLSLHFTDSCFFSSKLIYFFFLASLLIDGVITLFDPPYKKYRSLASKLELQ